MENPDLRIPLTNLEKIHSFDENNDGYDDVVVQDESGFDFYRNNEGNYELQTEENNPFADLDGTDLNVSFADVDRDGDTDVLSLNKNGNPAFYENLTIDGNKSPLVIDDSAKVVTDTSQAIPDLATPTIGDIDGDGDLDLVSSNSSAEVRYFRNDNGTFTVPPPEDNPDPPPEDTPDTDSLLNTSIYRFQNTEKPGTYLYAT